LWQILPFFGSGDVERLSPNIDISGFDEVVHIIYHSVKSTKIVTTCLDLLEEMPNLRAHLHVF